MKNSKYIDRTQILWYLKNWELFINHTKQKTKTKKKEWEELVHTAKLETIGSNVPTVAMSTVELVRRIEVEQKEELETFVHHATNTHQRNMLVLHHGQNKWKVWHFFDVLIHLNWIIFFIYFYFLFNTKTTSKQKVSKKKYFDSIIFDYDKYYFNQTLFKYSFE